MIHTAHLFMGGQLKNFAPSFGTYLEQSGNNNILPYCHIINWQKISNKHIVSTQNKTTEIVTDNDIKDSFINLYTNNVVVGMEGSDPKLKLIFYFPVYETEAWNIIKQLLEVLKSDTRFTYKFIGLSPDLYKTISGTAPESYSQISNDAKTVISDIKKTRNDLSQHNRFILLQNCLENGVSLNLNKDSLISVLGEFALAITENYHNIYNIADFPKDVSAIGISVLSLDKFYFINYLKRKAYLNALENEGITQTKVDIVKVNNFVQSLLHSRANIFKQFYTDYIILHIEQNRSKEDILQIITPEFNNYIDSLQQHLTSFLDKDDFSLPDKQAAFATLLGFDDDLFQGYTFSTDNNILDDCIDEAVNIYVDENNKLVTTIYDENGDPTGYKTGPISSPINKEGKTFSPLKEIKSLRTEILERIRHIRYCEDEINNLNIIDKIEQDSNKRFTKNGFVYDDTTFRIQRDIIETPLNETYDPANTTLEKNIDLTEHFTPIKNQGDVGSCTTFTIASIYEYILKKNGQGEHDLSERFVFYFTNILKNKPEGGSTFKEVIDTIAEKGICDEELCPYEIDLIQSPPTSSALEDALKHQIVKAMNVKVAHNDIVCALTQGYPVAISLKIFNSFASNYKGIVQMPTQEELDSDEYGFHAMVICGYNEDKHLYKVRNSWGESFGDNGYCYIPALYIEDEELNSFCCIITETKDGSSTGNISRSKIEFSKADSGITKALLLIEIENERRKLKKQEELSNSLSYNYQQLLLSIKNPETLREIKNQSRMRIENLISESTNHYNTTLSEKQNKIDSFKSESIRLKISAVLSCILSGSLSCLAFYYNWDFLNANIILPIIFGLVLIFTLFLFPYRKHKLKLLRKQLDEELAIINQDISNYRKELENISLRLHVAHMVVSKIDSIKSSLIKKYNHTKGYIGNLRIWYNETKENVSSMSCELTQPFLTVLDNNSLDTYFNDNCDNILREISLSDILRDSDGLSDEDIVNLKNSIENTINHRLECIIADFNMFNHLSGRTLYPYLSNNRLSWGDLLQRMNRYSNIFIQATTTNGTFEVSKSIGINITEEDRTQWHRIYPPYFQIIPNSIDILSKNKLIVISTHEFDVQDITLLR